MSNYQFIKIVVNTESVSLVLNRPPLNVLNIAMMKEMNDALEHLLSHPTAKVVMIRSGEKAFSAGVDVADHTEDRIEEMMREFHRIFENIARFEIPVVAAVDGAALGGGCELAIFCDMIVASERAKFGQPEIKVGVFPPVAAAVLPRIVGRNRALDLLLSGDIITAAEGERIGLVTKLIPVEDFELNVAKFVARFTAQSKIVLEMTKRAIDSGLIESTADAMHKAEAIYMKELMKTEDAQEGLRAFLEKRQPNWRNR